MNIILFLSTALIWGTTWFAIKFQLGIVHPVWSLIYRFALSAIFLLIYCFVRNHSLKFSYKQHLRIALQAFFMFFINYYLFYVGTSYFVSGIVAVLYASIIIMNMANGKIFLNASIPFSRVLAAFLGLMGLSLIFWNEIICLSAKNFEFVLEGLVVCLAGTLCASFGQTVAVSNQRQALPILQTNAIGMAYGTIMTLILALIMQELPTFDFSYGYVFSLLYLCIFGTIIAFGCYLKLIERIGADRAAYAFVLLPLIAMIFSTFFEELCWHTNTFIGAILILVGNGLVLMKKNPNKICKL